MEPAKMDAVAVARELGPQLAQRAATHDADDSFVADNYQEFKKHKLFSAGVPRQLRLLEQERGSEKALDGRP